VLFHLRHNIGIASHFFRSSPMSSLLLSPGMLWPAIVRRTAQALECGALCPIETVTTMVEDGGVRFIVRQVSSLVRKAQKRGTRSAQPADPFLPYDPGLFVADVSETHVALLNKFNVIEHHVLIVTRAFEEQEALLDIDDFTAWFACLAEFEGLGFYNGGVQAGASQRHKHMQIVPLPLNAADTGSPPLPIEPLIRASAAPRSADVAVLAGLPFAHAFARLAPASAPVAAHAALAAYLRLMNALGLGPAASGGKPACQAAPYNLLLTPHWMLLVPRTAEHAHCISVNALGFAGSLFVRDFAQMGTVRRIGPMKLLERVAMPRAAKP
jgi:sulfate adenylyltransferase (ADP) / ATP adenylyltransferase